MKIDEVKLDEVLLTLGHDDFTRGTAYIRTGVKLYEPQMPMSKELYPAVARQHGSTGARVERAMRHAIEKAWSRGSIDEQRRVFGWSVDPEKGRPCVGEYIARLARECREN